MNGLLFEGADEWGNLPCTDRKPTEKDNMRTRLVFVVDPLTNQVKSQEEFVAHDQNNEVDGENKKAL